MCVYIVHVKCLFVYSMYVYNVCMQINHIPKSHILLVLTAPFAFV